MHCAARRAVEKQWLAVMLMKLASCLSGLLHAIRLLLQRHARHVWWTLYESDSPGTSRRADNGGNSIVTTHTASAQIAVFAAEDARQW